MAESYLIRLRKEAKLTQEEVARISGLSQSMISRIEADPKTASIDNLIKILEALGMDLKQILLNPQLVNPGEFTSSPDNLGSINPVDPYVNLRRNVQRIKEFLAEHIPTSSPDAELKLLTELANIVQAIDRKPNLYLAGRSDAGKSRLANTILGHKILPSFYTPATRLLTIVRHLEDRPSWLKEEVVILNSEFNPNNWNDSEHIQACRLLAGGYETLHHYGTHKESQPLPQAFAAMVFVDANVLKTCNIIDTPGLLNNEEDTIRAEAGMYLLDILVYLSPVSGFIDATDVVTMSDCIKRLPILENKLPRVDKLSNLFVVLSHAAPHISTEEISNIFAVKARILHSHLSDLFEERWEASGLTFTADDLLQRMFAFWYETSERHKPLRHALAKTLSDTVAQYQNISANTLIQNYQTAVDTEFRRNVDLYASLDADGKKFSEMCEKAIADLPLKKKQASKKRQDVLDSIDDLREESLETLDEIFEVEVTEKKIEDFLKKKFKNKKDEAKEFAFPQFLEMINKQVTNSISSSSRKLNKKIDGFLSSYERIAMSFPGAAAQGIDIPFDVKGNFIGGLGAAGAIGALGTWAAALGNLGGYIVVSKMVGWLSAVGVGFGWSGGSAGVTSIVAALGGPITLGLAAAGAAGIAAWALLGDSWETRLARRMLKVMEEKNLRKKYRTSIRKYWKDTNTAFNAAADQLEKSFAKHVRSLKNLSLGTKESKAGLEQTLAALTKLRHAIPILWKPLGEEEKG